MCFGLKIRKGLVRIEFLCRLASALELSVVKESSEGIDPLMV
jgi:hypothetical protein